ncbi:basement membrane-specific heparan sulfate proteoglycan core protein-like isoform X2 [Anopheles darlingi]|uniref:basement membrane-specific heparan sulfate proteoglycan core protein-like isoform X2 n=1 Tax=Anopheles darlingi TaxID=43151 RepID=UPI002100310A|nr:basement membrane-specific heparan sulfate proteoglycan core protein-like isoform X2 [Anopheles darlingi]
MPRLFDVVVVALLLPIASSVLGYAIPKLEMTVSEGKPLKMGVFNYENLQTYIPRWYHDGRLITADYKRCIANYGELRCPSMTLQDKGLYELWGTSRTNVGLRQLLFHANVAVEEEEEEEEEEERVQMAAIEDLPYEERDDCFCSGVTGRCRTANYLYRARLSYNMSKAEMVYHRLPNSTDPSEKVIEPFLSIPVSFIEGNLLTSYGGYFYFQVPDECWSDRTKPCMVLIGKNDLTVGYFLPEDATSKPFYVPIKETSWKVLRSERLPYGSVVDRFDFLYLLSKVRVIYLANHTTRRDSQLVVDVASTQDTGLGWVGTVEECDCHEGYRGLSCESCDDGYYRSYDTISKNGICLRLEQLWYMHKRQHRLT